MQTFLTSLEHPFALVRHGTQTPGKRVGTSMAWLSWRNPDGTYSGGEIKLKVATGVWRRGFFTQSRWRFTYKNSKKFHPEDVVHRFGQGKGYPYNEQNTERVGGPFSVQINRVKQQLPKVPDFDQVERPATEGGVP